MSTRLSLSALHFEPEGVIPALPTVTAAPSLHELLSEREEEIAMLAARGLSNKHQVSTIC